jgi:hypothetical protein
MSQKPQIASQRKVNKGKIALVRMMVQDLWDIQYPGIKLILSPYPSGKFLNIGWKLGPYHWERDFEILPAPNTIELSCTKAVQVLEEVFKRTAIDYFIHSMNQWQTQQQQQQPKTKK